MKGRDIDWLLAFDAPPSEAVAKAAANATRMVAEYGAMFDNLTATQKRCTELLEETRRVRAVLKEKDADVDAIAQTLTTSVRENLELREQCRALCVSECDLIAEANRLRDQLATIRDFARVLRTFDDAPDHERGRRCIAGPYSDMTSRPVSS